MFSLLFPMGFFLNQVLEYTGIIFTWDMVEAAGSIGKSCPCSLSQFSTTMYVMISNILACVTLV